MRRNAAAAAAAAAAVAATLTMRSRPNWTDLKSMITFETFNRHWVWDPI